MITLPVIIYGAGVVDPVPVAVCGCVCVCVCVCVLCVCVFIGLAVCVSERSTWQSCIAK